MKPLLGLAALSLFALQGETPLRRTLKEGTETYKMDSKVTQMVTGPMGEMPMKMTSSSTYALKTLKVDEAAGVATIEATTTMDKLEADGMMGQMLAQQKPKPSTQTGKLDVRGRITFEKSAGSGLTSMLSGAQATTAAGTFVEFPEKGVKVGDTWEIVVPKNPMLIDQDQKLTAKLVGEKDFEGVPVWVVSITGTIKTNIDTSKLPKDVQLPEGPMGQTTLVMKGEAALNGEGLVEKSTGKTLQMTTKSDTKSTIDITSMGIKLDSTGQIESTSKLVKPQA